MVGAAILLGESLWSTKLIIVGTILQGAAQNMGMFVAARGIIVGLVFCVRFGLMIGIWSRNQHHRCSRLHPRDCIPDSPKSAHVSCLCSKHQVSAHDSAVYNALWNVGSLIAAWVTYGTFTMGNSRLKHDQI